MPMKKGPAGTGFKISFEGRRPGFIFESCGCPDFPRDKFGGMRDPTGIVFAETPFQILSEANVDFFRMGFGFEDVNGVSSGFHFLGCIGGVVTRTRLYCLHV